MSPTPGLVPIDVNGQDSGTNGRVVLFEATEATGTVLIALTLTTDQEEKIAVVLQTMVWQDDAVLTTPLWSGGIKHLRGIIITQISLAVGDHLEMTVCGGPVSFQLHGYANYPTELDETY